MITQKTQGFDPAKPFNQLPRLRAQSDIETKSILKQLITVRSKLATLRQLTETLPNPTMLVNLFYLLESEASSRIENIVTTQDQLFLFQEQFGQGTDAATQETLRYRAALAQGMASIQDRPLSVNMLREICSTIKGYPVQVRSKPGTFIGSLKSGAEGGVAIYTPPVGKALIEAKLDDLLDFIHNSSDLDPLTVIAMAHYQFEAIHPFEDGNGRTGRIANLLLLVQTDILKVPLLNPSAYINANRADYYARLQAVTIEGAWQPWISFMLSVFEVSANDAIHRIESLARLQQHIESESERALGASPHPRLMAALFEQPYCRIAFIEQRCGVSRPTASKWLNALADSGVLRLQKMGRESLFINQRLVDLATGKTETETNA